MDAITCPRCGADNGPSQWACAQCGTSLAHRYDESLRPQACPVCGGALEHGRAELRTGTGPGIAALFDIGAGWSFRSVVVAVCVRCGHMDLYAG